MDAQGSAVECQVNVEDLAQDGIPTFDASDVDHQLTKKKSALERSIARVAIAIISYNPLPLLRIALVQAHTDSHSQHKRARSSAFDVTCDQHGLDDLELHKPSDQQHSAATVIVDDLPPTIQSAFRQSVLRALIVYSSAVTAIVVSCLLSLPTTALIEQAAAQSTVLVSAVTVSLYAIVALLAALLYVLRFDSPINSGVLGLLTLTQVVCIILFGDPHKIVPGLALFVSGLVLLSAIVCRIPRCKTTNQPLEMTDPTKAVSITIVVLFAVAVPINSAMGYDVTLLSTVDVIEVALIVGGALLWVSQVLSVLTHTMAPEGHTSALVYFQADLVVVFLVMPSKAIFKRLRRITRLFQQPRDGDTGSDRKDAVLPVSLHEGGPRDACYDATGVVFRSAQSTTPLHRGAVHLIPYQGHVRGCMPSTRDSLVDADDSVDGRQGGPRYRNSISH